MESAIYYGKLRHRRFHPKLHCFNYDVFMMYLDLNEINKVLSLSPFWSAGKWRPAQFRRTDFIGDPQIPIEQAVKERIKQETGDAHEGAIRVLTNLRYFGFIINPITCYYCFDAENQLRTIVAEVTNTPWNERHSYVIHYDPQRPSKRIEFNKEMHVSPFNPMKMLYSWQCNQPGNRLRVNIETLQNKITELDASLVLRRQEINTRALNRLILQYPFMTIKVAWAIYWQALKLWIKGVPYFKKPGKAKNQNIEEIY